MRDLMPMRTLHNELDRVFDTVHDNFFRQFNSVFGTSGSLLHAIGQSEFPKTNVIQKGKDIIFQVSVPSYNPDDITVSLNGDTLTINGKCVQDNKEEDQKYLIREIAQRSFSRSWKLPTQAHEENIDASYDKGILRIVVKDVCAEITEPKSRKIVIKQL